MIIRPGIEADVFKLSRLWRKLVEETMPDEHPNLEWWRHWTINALRSGNYFIFIADDGGKLVGFTSFTIGQEPANGKIIATGKHIYVLPEHRKGKVGASLHRENLKKASESGASSWILYCADNEKKVWMKKGFKVFQTMMIKNMEA